MWPLIFELSVGGSRHIPTDDGDRIVRLVSFDEYWEPDYWSLRNPDHKIVSYAKVIVDVSGQRANLLMRPYQMPVVINGLRLYVEATRNLATRCNVHPLMNMLKDVRFAALDTKSSWGPPDLIFPIKDFRWRSSSYNNTWGAYVPAPDRPLYYHRGEDFGAIPDNLEVLSMMDGLVIESPLPNITSSNSPTVDTGKGANSVKILSPSGIFLLYAHMNIECISSSIIPGAEIKSGQPLGKTGSTWQGFRSMHIDPHLHISFHRGDPLMEDVIRSTNAFGSYPFTVRSYLETYDDKILAVAGGYHFTVPGMPVTLDATRSICRRENHISSYTWKLHDGSLISSPITSVVYDQPGLYSEELTVVSEDKTIDRDFAQIRVYDPETSAGTEGENSIAYGWAYHFPVRGIRPHSTIAFWSRIVNHIEPVYIDFGDGSPPQQIDDEIEYAFSWPGIYTVKLYTRGEADQPVEIKMKVVVED